LPQHILKYLHRVFRVALDINTSSVCADEGIGLRAWIEKGFQLPFGYLDPVEFLERRVKRK
jgi:hypothetical protein